MALKSKKQTLFSEPTPLTGAKNAGKEKFIDSLIPMGDEERVARQLRDWEDHRADCKNRARERLIQEEYQWPNPKPKSRSRWDKANKDEHGDNHSITEESEPPPTDPKPEDWD